MDASKKSKILDGDTFIEKRTTHTKQERNYEIGFTSGGGRSVSRGRRIDEHNVITMHSMPSGRVIETTTGAVQTRRDGRTHQHGSGPVHVPTTLGYTPGPTANGFRSTTISPPTYGPSTITNSAPVVRRTKWK
jgi:hypothetical protein